MSETFQPIPDTFHHDIYTHYLIARQGDVAMYAKTQTRGNGPRWEYEVVIVRVAEACLVFGKPQPARERLPSNEGFGHYGWHFTAMSQAWQKFEALVRKRKVTAPLLKHPRMEQFENSITVQLFDSRRRPAGTMQRRCSTHLDAIRVESLIPA